MINLKTSKYTKYALVFLMIVLSGCVYFTQVKRIWTVMLFFVLATIYKYEKNKHFNREKTYIYAFFCLMVTLSFVANINSMTSANKNDHILIFVTITGLFITMDKIKTNNFFVCYINIMCIIAVISLICFYIQITDNNLVLQLGSKTLKSGYMISWYHTWGWSYIFGRNAGPFWEPGAFQGYLAIAILMIFNNNQYFDNKKEYCKLILLSIAILTTMSATGYVVLALLVACYVIQYIHKYGKRRAIRALLIILLGIIAVIWLLNSSAVSNKLSDNNLSFLSRMSDFKASPYVIIKVPLWGFGVMNPYTSSLWNNYGATGASVGMVNTLLFWGIPMGVVYYVLTFKGIIKAFYKLNKIFVCSLFVVLFVTETLTTFPVYLCFLFVNKSKEIDCANDLVK